MKEKALLITVIACDKVENRNYWNALLTFMDNKCPVICCHTPEFGNCFMFVEMPIQ